MEKIEERSLEESRNENLKEKWVAKNKCIQKVRQKLKIVILIYMKYEVNMDSEEFESESKVVTSDNEAGDFSDKENSMVQ
ncbi:unnamed protein product [Ilex paraguariensis]|uniref:Uncharacterized protein n=1 Tax=Ilex paraguariensis TaxID=185542 RepID=A0ABC8QP86_9AQUA